MRGAAVICLLVLGMALAGPGVATAQAAGPAEGQTAGQTGAPPPPAVLVADDVYMEGNERLVATGNVEALYDGTRLQAEGIIYDRTEDTLILSGPIVIHEDGESIILASSGEIDKELRNGILRGARIVMGDHVQLAAQELNRSAGRYNQLVKVSVTSCRVCETGRAPLWQIRARRVIHDQEEKQLYFEDAQFRVLDTPASRILRFCAAAHTYLAVCCSCERNVCRSATRGLSQKLRVCVLESSTARRRRPLLRTGNASPLFGSFGGHAQCLLLKNFHSARRPSPCWPLSGCRSSS